ncbi:MAG: hypothetical protein V1818_03525 [Candidatus Aenigmatarchaeota archaeon]
MARQYGFGIKPIKIQPIGLGFERKDKKRIPKKILRRMVWERDKGRCKLCGVKIRAGEDWDLARIKAGSKGGEYTYANCFVAHHTCNTSQGNLSLKQAKRSIGVSKGNKKKSTKKKKRSKSKSNNLLGFKPIKMKKLKPFKLGL